jgi:enoyl-CoA hydratase
MHDFETLLLERRTSVDVLTLNRPSSLNAMTPVMIAELTDYFRALESTPAVRVVLLRGAGRAFCAGLDLHDMAARLPTLDQAAIYAEQRTLSRMILAMRAVDSRWRSPPTSACARRRRVCPPPSSASV